VGGFTQRSPRVRDHPVAGAVLSLYPFCFIEMDGYHVLVDVLGVRC